MKAKASRGLLLLEEAVTDIFVPVVLDMGFERPESISGKVP